MLRDVMWEVISRGVSVHTYLGACHHVPSALTDKEHPQRLIVFVREGSSKGSKTQRCDRARALETLLHQHASHSMPDC